MRKALILPIAATALVAAAIVLVLIFRYIVSPVSADPTQVPFTIAKGEPVSTIADALEKEGLIRSALAYRIFVRVSGFETKIQAGQFSIPRNLSMKDLTYWIARGTNDQTITTLEGWRIEEIAQYLDTKKVISKEEFLEAAGTVKLDYDFLPKPSELDRPYRRLEGYLFPDTYRIPAQASPERILRIMLDNFSSRVTTDIKNGISRSGQSLADGINLASIVEREVRSSADRPIVAGILLKRLKTTGKRLEADATVQFTQGSEKKWWPQLSDSAKNISPESPYNSYTHDGLPPTPISNPGLASIQAVAAPQTTDYWFYISDKEGKMHYAATIEEHSANIAKYLR